MTKTEKITSEQQHLVELRKAYATGQITKLGYRVNRERFLNGARNWRIVASRAK